MTIGTILDARSGDIATATCATPVGEVVALLAARRIGAVPVMDGARVAGILSERDVVCRLAMDGAAVLAMRADAVMTAPAITVGRAMSLLTGLSLMTERRIRHLPVVEDEVLVGFVSIGDLVKARIDRIEAEAQAMRSYIQAG